MATSMKTPSVKHSAGPSPDTSLPDVPGISKPAVRALLGAGYATLGALDGADWDALKALHGVGPSAGERL